MRLFVECAFPHLGKRGGTSRKGAVWTRRLTERRILRTSPSRKTAFWGRHLTERRSLVGLGIAECAFPWHPHQKAQFGHRREGRLRFSV